MQDRGGGLSGTADDSHLADGRAAVGRSGWHGICSPGKYRLCLYGVAAQPWSYKRFDRCDSDPGSARAVWPRSLDRYSWCCVVPTKCTTPLSHHWSGDPDLPLRLPLAWSLGWVSIHCVPYRPTRHSSLSDHADNRCDRPCHALFFVSAVDDPTNAEANIDISIGLQREAASLQLFPTELFFHTHSVDHSKRAISPGEMENRTFLHRTKYRACMLFCQVFMLSQLLLL
jgi:hypothetical protein